MHPTSNISQPHAPDYLEPSLIVSQCMQKHIRFPLESSLAIINRVITGTMVKADTINTVSGSRNAPLSILGIWGFRDLGIWLP